MLGIYLHIPFCIKKCFYCDFYSLESQSVSNLSKIKSELNVPLDEDMLNLFLSALHNEIKIRTIYNPDKIKVDTIFLGGGTPSLLSINQIRSLFLSLKEFFNFNENCEITIECNPGTLTPNKLEVYKELNINRLSLGVQSFIPEELHFLQRIHTSKDVLQSFKLARDFGFDNISFDFIFSIPGQTKDNLIYTLTKACELMPDHISAYSLIFERGTPLYNEMKKGKIKPVNEDIDSEYYETVIDFLAKMGYDQYEVSNFARNGKKCKHNLKYWHNEEYLAFGPSAHGFYQNIRYKNKRSLKSYINLLKSNKLPTDTEEYQTEKLKITDSIFLGLRSDGIDLKKIFSFHNLDLKQLIKDELEFYQQNDLIKINEDKISLTKNGYKICDSITLEIISKVERFFFK